MKIEVKENIFWDTEASVQSNDAIDWYNSEIYNDKMNKVTPEKDSLGRPSKWTIDEDTFTVMIERVYRNKTWAKDKDIVTISQK